ncbi:hypothetical protein [Variovorax sp. tm]|uniref:hypothetical protein n=1 Tax=Variovorax atrisoli TaxID=3394203 RepID=UPI003A7FB457
MTSSQFAAESLLRTYLSGRSMPRILRDAVVCVIEARLTNNETPTLDETLRMDIDNHAVAPSGKPIARAVQRRLGEMEVATHAGASAGNCS